jgi:uncharacterized protein with HEPN domain
MRTYAGHVHDAIVGLKFETFAGNPHLRMIVERGLEIIGEAARSVSPEFQSAHPEIPWRQIIGLRNVLIHQYGEIDHQTIWRIATEDLPNLVETLKSWVPSPPPDPEP